MKTTIITIICIISMITLVSAITMYPGGCYYLEFPNSDPVNWSVEGNSSNMNGFSYTKIGTNITYCFHPLYKPDNFTITFYNYQSVEVKEYEDSDSCCGGGYYTYPWRTNQTSNQTQINQTDVNQSIDQTDLNATIDIKDSELEDISFWRRFWNWLKGIFGK